MPHYRFPLLIALTGVVLGVVCGCGGVGNGPVVPTVAAASPDAPAIRAAYIGNWAGSWAVGAGGGDATLSVQKDGSYTLVLKNYRNISETIPSVTLLGNMTSGGSFSGTIPGSAAGDSFAGSLSIPLSPPNTLRGSLVQTHRLVNTTGTITLAR